MINLHVALAFCLLPAMTAAKIPVILDTDIGGDIDDTWALAQLLRTPELDVKLVLVGTGDTRYRSELTAKFLEVSGRTDVPIGVGHFFGAMRDQDRLQGDWLKGYDVNKYPGVTHDDGIGAMIDLILRSPEPVTVIAIGPVPNISRALEREPRIAANARFVGMHGSFEVGYGGGPPVAETNVRLDPAALRTVLAAPWREIILTPLDTCGFAYLTGVKYHSIWSATHDPMLRALIENYCLWSPRVPWMHVDYFALRSTTLFDCVAVYLAYDGRFVEFEDIVFDVTDDGFTRRNPDGPFRARVAMKWRNLEAFEDHLVERLHDRAR